MLVAVASEAWGGEQEALQLFAFGPDLAADTSYGIDGVAELVTVGERFVDDDHPLVSLADGSTMIACLWDDAVHFAHVGADGTQDLAYGGGDGWVTSADGGTWDHLQDIALDPEGRIVYVGRADGTDGDPADGAVARFYP